MMTRENILSVTARTGLLVLLATIVSACSGVVDPPKVPTETVGSPHQDVDLAYLEGTIPPCTPLAGSRHDPCRLGIAEVEPRSVGLSYPVWPGMDVIPTFDQILLGYSVLGNENYPHYVPHIVVRATVVPDTTRCEPYPRWLANYYDPSRSAHSGGAYTNYECFSDVRVNDYIVGIGPPRLTVRLHIELIAHYFDTGRNPADWPTRRDSIIEELDDPRTRTAAAYEGKELILFLEPSQTLAVEAWMVNGWSSFELWFVQRGEDIVIHEVGSQFGGPDLETTVATPDGEDSDEIRAVAQAILWARDAVQRDKLNVPLSQLVQEVKKAAQNRTAITGGRIGVDTGLPMLVTDANQLRAYYTSVGAVYEGDEATVLPTAVVPGTPQNLAVSESWVVSWDPPDRGGQAHWYRLELRFTSGRVLLITSDRTVNITRWITDRLGQNLDIRVRAHNIVSKHGQWTDTLTYTNITTTSTTTTTSG